MHGRIAEFVRNLAFLAIYIALDWISFVHSIAGVQLTPWNPQVGLAIAFILLCRLRSAPAVLLAPVLADLLTRSAEVPPSLSVAISCTAGSIYLLFWTSTYQMAFRLGFSAKRLSDLVAFFAMACLSAALVSFAAVLWYRAYGLIRADQAPDAFLRAWVGDWIGIAIMVPLLFQIAGLKAVPSISRGMLLHAALLAGTLALVFWAGQPFRLHLFYLLFLPVVAIAAAYGFDAVVVALAVVQVAIIAADKFWGMSGLEVTTLQGFLVVLSATGMTAGLLVLQRKQAEAQMWQRQERQSYLRRRGSLSELATLIAHEVNQPLTAAQTYTRLIGERIKIDMPGSDLAELARKSEEQVSRAAEVVRKLRQLVRLGRGEQVASSIIILIEESVALVQQAQPALASIPIRFDLAAALPKVLADPVQIEQVIINLLVNALQSASAKAEAGAVTIKARETRGGDVEVLVLDNGPGFQGDPDEIIDGLRSTKPEGLGVGLALSRTIVQIHAGEFAIQTDKNGACVSFTLRKAE